MNQQSMRINAEIRKSRILGDRFTALALRIHQLRDYQFDMLDTHEEKTLVNIEQCLLALAKARIGVR